MDYKRKLYSLILSSLSLKSEIEELKENTIDKKVYSYDSMLESFPLNCFYEEKKDMFNLRIVAYEDIEIGYLTNTLVYINISDSPIFTKKVQNKLIKKVYKKLKKEVRTIQKMIDYDKLSRDLKMYVGVIKNESKSMG